jgi:hypothetical protein
MADLLDNKNPSTAEGFYDIISAGRCLPQRPIYLIFDTILPLYRIGKV